MAHVQASPKAPTRPPLSKAARLVTATPMVAAVPFTVAVLFRLGLSTLVVLLLCALTGVALLAVPRRGPWLALGWAVGCVLWAAAVTVLIVQVA